MSRSPRALDVLAVLFATGAVILVALPPFTDVSPAAVRMPARTAAPSAGTARAVAESALDSAARDIVRTNVFSGSRREPTARFAAPGLETTPPPTFVASESDAGMGSAPVDDGPRLFGIVSMDGALHALVQLRAADETPRLMRAGESQHGVRVQRVDQDRVVISTSTGTRTLRLSRAVPDSLENAP